MRASRVLAPLVAACLLSLAACEDGLQPGSGFEVRILPGDRSDTIDVSSTLVAEVRARGPLGQPAAGVEVVFQASRADGDPTGRYTLFLVKPFCCGGFVVRDTTDRDGRASVTVVLGSAAGEGIVVASTPESDVADTARFTTNAGAPAAIAVSPRDRPIAVGSSYQLDARPTDRRQNPVPGTPVFSTAATAIQLSPTGVVQGSVIGRAKVSIQIGALSDSAFTSVVPPATLALRDYSGFAGDSTGYAQMDLDGSNYRRVANTDVLPHEYSPSNFLAPQWIPGTGQLLHLRPVAGANRLFVLDSTGAARRLIDSAGGISSEADPDVSSDGAWVYFIGYSAGGDAVWRVAASGGVPETLTVANGIAHYRWPSVSPDGNELVYVASMSAGDQFHAYVRNLSTGETRQLSTNEAAGTRWSPAGEWILYALSGPYEGYSGHLRLVRPDGTDDHELIDGAYYPGGSWSPDGKYVLVVRADFGPPELIDVTTGSRLPLVYPRVWYGPAWRR
jgi:Tol biopolymer transport system component